MLRKDAHILFEIEKQNWLSCFVETTYVLGAYPLRPQCVTFLPEEAFINTEGLSLRHAKITDTVLGSHCYLLYLNGMV